MKNNIGLFVAKRAALQPDREAIVDIASGKRLSYGELDARCNQLGSGLLAGGLSVGDRVATLMLNSAEFV
jgi:acyl-CoA synthetase (AMP-forming)/AMP-acid ligase II